MSEGINFSDGLARCVVMVGLPYPDKSDPELVQKMNYLDAQERQQRMNVGTSGGGQGSGVYGRGGGGGGGGGGGSAGQEYYQNLCMRAVNQSIGRAIRHIGDFAAILLVDERYAKKRSIIRKLPGWIGERTKAADNFSTVIRELRQFFSGPGLEALS